jgi:hypothetical protein
MTTHVIEESFLNDLERCTSLKEFKCKESRIPWEVTQDFIEFCRDNLSIFLEILSKHSAKVQVAYDAVLDYALSI